MRRLALVVLLVVVLVGCKSRPPMIVSGELYQLDRPVVIVADGRRLLAPTDSVLLTEDFDEHYRWLWRKLKEYQTTIEQLKIKVEYWAGKARGIPET